jgi:Ca2+-binding EF-hand superfamily protein
LVDSEEWYRHCRYCLASDDETYRMALEQHQDVTMDLTKSNSFSEADAEVDALIKSVRIDSLLDGLDDDNATAMPTSLPPSSRSFPLNLHEYSEKDLDLYFRRLFAIADADGSGELDQEEVADLLTMTGFGFDSDTVSQIVEMSDTNANGVIEYEEFIPMMLGVLGVKPETEEQPPASSGAIDMSRYSQEHLTVYFNQLFKLGDTNGDGVLQADEIEALLHMCGFDFSGELVAQVVQMADTNDDGVINYSEFVPMMIGIIEGSL